MKPPNYKKNPTKRTKNVELESLMNLPSLCKFFDIDAEL